DVKFHTFVTLVLGAATGDKPTDRFYLINIDAKRRDKMTKENEYASNQAGSPSRGTFAERRTRLSNLVSGLGKLPPQAVDLEEAVLGALMLEKNALSEVIDILKPETF